MCYVLYTFPCCISCNRSASEKMLVSRESPFPARVIHPGIHHPAPKSHENGTHQRPTTPASSVESCILTGGGVLEKIQDWRNFPKYKCNYGIGQIPNICPRNTRIGHRRTDTCIGSVRAGSLVGELKGICTPHML